ncbi:thiamine pyrophosphate-binding protein [Bradyrhizobium sp.]|jgi:acetolactate synthase-1/2/3 large subunit|uniref:thiamine pyrophosphate-binding protein n=1 Tax=Bradyrhizobium sp. TaxID=376 RepID=UPI002DFFF16F|nr:thiamine pyrophosphate-binding protein [Bradyrhizobium sp.]
MIRGADIVGRTLQDFGVTRIFTLSGNHIMPIFDALLSTNIQLIHARHEAACVHMADAWGRLTGDPGIALVTGGQGHSNAVAALYNALASESPLVLLSGHAPLGELGCGAFQEMAQADLARPVTKASWTATVLETLGSDIAKAFELAITGRPGPVHVSLPGDLLEQTIADEQTTRITKAELRPRAVPLMPEIADQAVSHLRAAAKPLVICGPAMCTERGRKVMRNAAAALDVPFIGMESPRGVNDPGLGAFAEILSEADPVMLIGKPLDFTLRFGEALSPSCKWIVIDPDAALIARVAKATGERLLLSAVADAQAAIDTLTERSAVARAKRSGWHEHVIDMVGYELPQWKSVRAKSPDRVHPIEMCKAVSNFVEKHPGATFVSDGGEIGQWAQAFVKTDRRIINGVAGTIGVSLPFAIAAKLARPDHPVVAVMGDGTFGFHMAEFDTAVRYDLPVIVVIGNDARWNAEYQIQLRQYGAERAKNCDLLPSRYDRVAEALGGFGALVSTAAGLSDALDRAYLSRRPACINVMIESVAAPIIRR